MGLTEKTLHAQAYTTPSADTIGTELPYAVRKLQYIWHVELGYFSIYSVYVAHRVRILQLSVCVCSMIDCVAPRLNITVTPPREKRTRQRMPMSEPVPKRARLHPHQHQSQQQEEQSITSTSSAGYIQVVDVEPSGRFIKIKNMSTQVGGGGGGTRVELLYKDTPELRTPP